MTMIALHKITGRDPYTDNEEGEGPQERTAPVTVNVAAIRCFYPRKENRPGTRITFTDGGGFAVSEPYDDVRGMIAPN